MCLFVVIRKISTKEKLSIWINRINKIKHGKAFTWRHVARTHSHHTDVDFFDYIELRCTCNVDGVRTRSLAKTNAIKLWIFTIYLHIAGVSLSVHSHQRLRNANVIHSFFVANVARCTPGLYRTNLHLFRRLQLLLSHLCTCAPAPCNLFACVYRVTQSTAHTTIIHFPNELRESGNKMTEKRRMANFSLRSAQTVASVGARLAHHSLPLKLLPVYMCWLWLLLLLILLFALICTAQKENEKIIKIEVK